MTKVLNTHILEIFPSPFGRLILEYNWLLLLLGLSLIAIAQISKIKKHRNPANRSIVSRGHDNITKPSSTVDEHLSLPQNTLLSSRANNIVNAVKQKVDWSPLAKGGANFKTSHLYSISPSQYVIKASSGGKLFAGFFIAMGLGVPGIMGIMSYNRSGLGWGLLLPFLAGSVFIVAGIAMLLFPRPRYIDKRIGWFWSGKKDIKNELELRKLNVSCPIKELVAIQIIAEDISSKNGMYTSWELNLVDKNAQRFNVMDHGDKRSILNDAKVLSNFLSIPIWNQANSQVL